MPTQNEIFEHIVNLKNAAQDGVRREYLRDLHDYTQRDTILYASAFSSRKLPQVPGFLVSITLEDIQGFMAALQGLKGEQLDLILHSPGGSLEAADQIVQYLRSKYSNIRAIVPQNAMSAATMIACACDQIVMGKHSAIGPIDPQINLPSQNGVFTAPAQAILDEFRQAKQEVIEDPRTAPLWISKIQSYPNGLLNICQSTIRLSIEKVAEWLNLYMFADLSPDKRKGQSIAEWLGNATLHKTHGRPINFATAREIGLTVDLLEDDQILQEKVLSVFHAMTTTLEITQCVKFIENHDGKGWYLNVNVQNGPR